MRLPLSRAGRFLLLFSKLSLRFSVFLSDISIFPGSFRFFSLKFYSSLPEESGQRIGHAGGHTPENGFISLSGDSVRIKRNCVVLVSPMVIRPPWNIFIREIVREIFRRRFFTESIREIFREQFLKGKHQALPVLRFRIRCPVKRIKSPSGKNGRTKTV